ncbi:type II secretion system F family protein [Streptomyces meridianus]|nr:type II secretion system F family protein [Streptomyces meridianus]
MAVAGQSALPLLAVPLGIPLVRLALRRRRERRTAAGTSAEVIDLCGTVAGELRAGRQPDEALRAALAGGAGVVGAPVMAAARFGGDVPVALREAAQRPGAEGLSGVAACWQVAADRGAGLAAGLERVAGALGAERDQQEELLAQLAGTRSTSVMLAVLPLFGMAMGAAMGARPLWFLLHTPEGLACLAIGGVLEAAGLWWTARIARSAAGRGPG